VGSLGEPDRLKALDRVRLPLLITSPSFQEILTAYENKAKIQKQYHEQEWDKLEKKHSREQRNYDDPSPAYQSPDVTAREQRSYDPLPRYEPS